jgi:protease PrsW
MFMALLLLSLIPGIAIAGYIYRLDQYDREPRRYLLVSFLLGMASVLPALVLELAAKSIWGDPRAGDSILFYALNAFLMVGASEECSKFLMVRLYAYPKKAFNEPFDGITYSVVVAMGFATLENISYVQQHGMGTAVLRMFLSVPAHGCFGVIMGYYLGLAKFSPEKSGTLIFKGLLLAILFHGSFDFFLFLQNNTLASETLGNGLLVLGALGSYFFALRLGLRSIRLHRELSRLEFEQNKSVVPSNNSPHEA